MINAKWKCFGFRLSIGVLMAGAVHAADGTDAESSYSAGQTTNFSVGGFVRMEAAAKTTKEENPFNQRGNVFNGVPVTRTGAFGTDTATRDTPRANNSMNLWAARAEIDMQGKFSPNLTGFAKFRAFFDPGSYDNFGSPNFFQVDLNGGKRGSPLEVANKHSMVDLPALYLDYSNGPLWLRVGNQQIAWGESIFFRVLDVPNGLDYRRHQALDWASEEFADKRVPSPAVRGSYRITEGLELEGFAQKFNPSVNPNPNTPYNFIASQFTVHERFGDVNNTWNVGGRLRGQLGDLGLQAIAVSRRNPDGVYRWTQSGVNRDFSGLPGSGALMAQTAFEISPSGVWSAREWFTYAGMARLNGLTGLNASISEFPAAGLLGAVPVPTKAAADAELDTFFQLAGGAAAGISGRGGLIGHIERVFPREEIIGFGANYLMTSEPGSILDQLITRFEATYTPKRTYTNTSLSRQFIEHSEWITSFVMEKHQRFSPDFPSTYMVFQWMHRTQSDMFGRHLSGMGANADRLPEGQNGWDAIAFALQQPFPNLTWRADLAVLYDLKGGLLIQPAVRWKPNKRFTMEAFYNHVDGQHKNDNIISTVGYARELTVRAGFQF